MGITITETRVQDKSSALNIKDIINIIYPVGSYYWSSNATSPSKLFGGTWEQIKDRFVLAAGHSYSVGSSGGEASHTLSVNEMPSHHHTHGEYITDGDYGYVPAGSHIGSLVHAATQNDSRGGVITDRQQTQADNGFIGDTGGSQPHNNMPPYITAYCWHRIA